MTNPTQSAKLPEDCQFIDTRSTYLGQILTRHCVTEQVVAKIKTLSRTSANELWRSLFGNAKHKFAIPKDSSICSFQSTCKLDINWRADFENPASMETLMKLRNAFQWQDVDGILIVTSPNCIVYTDWRIFLENWRSFFSDDDEAYVIRENSSDWFAVGPLGLIITQAVT